ncbi:hypothetical protein MNBD_NITROSPIRAE03-1225 [hydrothermal vent metagenome]|uniref:Uncharacterized protein n=1 Tax=hydrothermal vent metagenome TaxID=652676 RepID=A0A3B1DIJ7_9ZZZZ
MAVGMDAGRVETGFEGLSMAEDVSECQAVV